jgi:hypothetical protein
VVYGAGFFLTFASKGTGFSPVISAWTKPPSGPPVTLPGFEVAGLGVGAGGRLAAAAKSPFGWRTT